MIIVGTMEWASTIERGDFFCPVCNAAKTYQRKIARPFLTLYFIPMIPIGGLREFVVCRSCRERFDTEVLQPGQAAEMLRDSASAQVSAAFESEILRLMALVIVEDERVSPAEIAMARRVYQGMFLDDLPPSELDRACREVVALRIDAARYVGIAGQGMSHDQKLKCVQAMFAVASAEGRISPRRMKSLVQAQQQLELDDVAFQTAIKDAGQWIAL